MLRIRRAKRTRRRPAPWTRVEVDVDGEHLHGRFRMEEGQLVLEWRGGRDSMGCGLVRPEVLAEHLLRVHAEDEGANDSSAR